MPKEVSDHLGMALQMAYGAAGVRFEVGEVGRQGIGGAGFDGGISETGSETICGSRSRLIEKIDAYPAFRNTVSAG